MEITKIVSSLGSIVGDAQVHAESAEIEAVVKRGEWENRPLAIVTPTDAAQVVELVRFAEREGVAAVPSGGCTRLHIGYPPSPDKPYIILSTAQFNKIIDFQP
ncbi:MAG: FAD-binding protein, partial [Armatimonadetes bacterium]|nr:FAD-binding protein [Armatimonadota bacterium]